VYPGVKRFLLKKMNKKKIDIGIGFDKRELIWLLEYYGKTIYDFKEWLLKK